MNTKVLSTACLLALATCAAMAQPMTRRIYPLPKLTPAVRSIQAQSRAFSPRPLRVGEQLPTSVDNSKSIYFPPIINQTGGSCAQASGIGYMYTYEVNRMLGRDAKASAANRFSYLFSWNMINGGEDQGGFVEEGLHLAKMYGMMTEADYGASGAYGFRWASGYDKYLRAMQYRTDEVLTFSDSIPLLKRYLYDAGNGSATGGILTFSTLAEGWRFNNNYDGPSETGYHSLLTKLATDGAHALTIAGYDDLVTYTDDNGVVHHGAFIVVNSWGTYYHDNGRFYLPYDFFRKKRQEYELSSELQGVTIKEYSPQIVYKVNLTYTSRNDLSFGMASTANAAATAPQTAYTYNYAFRNMGGDHPMCGSYSGNSIELALDFPARAANASTARKYFLNVWRSARGKLGEGTVDSITVFDYRFTPARKYVCRNSLPQTLGMGMNLFAITVMPLYYISASPYHWLTADGRTDNTTYLLRTSRHKQAKIQFTSYDAATGNVSLRYAVFN